MQEEREKRRRARNDLIIYASSIEIPGAPGDGEIERDDEHEQFIPIVHRFGAHHLLWLKCLQQVEDGEIKRLMGLMPPGAGKSVYTSVVFPTHYLGRFPKRSVIVASYGSDLPRKFGRRARSIVKQRKFQRIFDCALAEESAAVDEWALTNGSEWMAAGILTGITGNRMDGIIWDDLIKGREQADSDVVRQKTWDAYMDDLMTRKKPTAFEVGINCMVGSTVVTMADGSRKLLKDIKPNDIILSYCNGRIISAKVLNWVNQGLDSVFTIKTKSGTTVTANRRHPFLVERKGKLEWVRLKSIIVGDHVLKVTGENGGGSTVKNVTDQPNAVDFVRNTTASGDGKKGSDPLQLIQTRTERAIYATVTGLISTITKICSRLKTACAQFVDGHQMLIQQDGGESFALTTATPQAKCAGYSAMTVTTSSERTLLRPDYWLQPNTSEIILDLVVSIEPSGIEEVFDIQVENTENFIANGLVSHNTRWHEDDPAGRILPPNYNGESGWMQGQDGNDWYVVCLPAECERKDDPLNREIGEILWPEWFTPDHFKPFKRNARTWSALFQQRPAPETGDFFKAEWLKHYDKMPERESMHVYGASDYAVSVDGDFTVHVVVGIDPQHNIYLLDLWRGQTTSDVWIETLCNLVAKWRPMGWAEESGQIKAGIGPFLVKRLRERQLFLNRVQFPTRGDKKTRAASIQGRMAMNGLYVPTFQPWYPEFKRELMAFDAGRNDDQVDALGLIGQVLDKMVSGHPLAAEPQKPKVFSTDPVLCTVTLDDMFEANENRSKRGIIRIH